MVRRDFLKFSGFLGGMAIHGQSPFLWNLMAKVPRASHRALKDHFFVHLQIEGAADVLQSLDPYFTLPKVGDDQLFRGYQDSDILKMAGMHLGPAAHALAPHAQDFSVINGLWMTNNIIDSHEQCRTYMASGQTMAQTQSTIVPAEAAFHLGTGPYGVVVNTTQEWRNYSRALVSVTTSKQLDQVAEDDFRPILEDLMNLIGGTDFDQSLSDFAKAAKLVNEYLKTKDQYKQEQKLEQLDDFQIAALALASGICRQAHLNLGGDFTGPGPGLDSHGGSNYPKVHLPNQKWHWDKVAEIFQLFKSIPYGDRGLSLFDNTTFLVTNEFSRPPHLDEGDGKGHNPWNNSALIAGKGVRGGQTVGLSFHMTKEETGVAPTLQGCPFDFVNGKAISKTEMAQSTDLTKYKFLRPQNVVATVADILGYTTTEFQTIPASTQVIPGLKL